MATLQTEFSLEDIKIARDVIKTYPCGMSRVALNAPGQGCCIGSSNSVSKDYKTGYEKITYRTLKMQYAIEVWHRAVSISKINPGPLLYYWWLNWIDNSNGFRSIVYSESLKYYNVDQTKLITDFVEQLRQIANSGKIKVHEYWRSVFRFSSANIT